MGRVELESGAFVEVKDSLSFDEGTFLTVGFADRHELGPAQLTIEMVDLDEIDRIAHLLATGEGDQEPGEQA